MDPLADKPRAPREAGESADAALDPAFFVAERYEFLRVIGDGLMGVVFEMRDRETQRLIAARLITHAQPRRPKRFARQLDSLSRIEHPHLAHFLAYIERDGMHYVLSQFAEGVDLFTYLRQPATAEELAALRQREEIIEAGITDTQEVTQTGPIDISESLLESAELLAEEPGEGGSGLGEESAAEIVESVVEGSPEAHQALLDLVLLRLERVLPQIVDALAYLHRFKKHHGDLKPGNILVDHTGRCLLTDFGLVQHLTPRLGVERAPAEGSAAQPGAFSTRPSPPSERALADSYAYRAPENLDFDGLPDAGPSADLYALGCVLFEAISGQRPFEGSAEEIRAQQLEADPPAILDIEPYCPASWAELIHGLLAKNPERRASLGDIRGLIAYSESYAIDIPASAIPEQDLFFGRSDILDVIQAQVRECYRKKHLGMTLLRGPAGVGKTAIAQAVAYLLSRRGWLVLNGRCYERESLIYQGWDEIGAQIARIYDEFPADFREKLDQCRREAATLFPILSRPEDPPTPSIARLDAVDSFRSLLRRIASQRPILLVIDDLHWASWDTSALLLDLLGEPRGLRCVVLGTWLGEQNSAPKRGAGHPLIEGLESTLDPVLWVDLGGFSPDEAREYVISAGSHLTMPEQQRVLLGGAANPLLLEELIHITREEGLEARRELLWEEASAAEAKKTAQPAPPDEQRASETLLAVVAERLETLSRRDQFILEVLSVASIPLPTSIISTILGDEFGDAAPGKSEARAALDHLLKLRFIVAVKSHHWEVAYSVSHNSYRAMVLEQLREQRYAHLCKRIAEGIRRCWPSAEELRFEYLLRAGLSREAADSAVRAAAVSEQRFAYNRAAKLWRWLEENSAHISVTPGLSPRVEHARMERLAHRYPQAAQLWGEVAEQAEPGFKRAGYLREQFHTAAHAGDFSQALGALEQALQNLGEAAQPGGLLWRVEALNNRLRAALSAPRPDEVIDDKIDPADALRADIYEQILDIADLLNPRQVDRIRARLVLLAHRTKDAKLLGLKRFYQAQEIARTNSTGRIRQIDHQLDMAQALFERAEEPLLLGGSELFRAEQFQLRGDFERAEESLAAAAKFFHRAQPHQLGHRHELRLGYARLLSARGELAEASRVARQTLHHWRGDKLVMLRAYQTLLPIELIGGHTEAADVLLGACRQIVSALPTNLSDIWLARQEAQLQIARGHAEVAVGQLDILVERAHKDSLDRSSVGMALLYLSLGQALAALAQREQSLVTHRRTDTLSRLSSVEKMLRRRQRALPPVLLAEALRLRCRLKMLQDKPKKGIRLLNAALGKLARFPNAVSWTKSLEARSHLLAQLDHPDAPAFMEQAFKAYRQFGARLPLFLEGWPIPERFASGAEPDNKS